MTSLEQQIEHARPDTRDSVHGAGWNAHRAGLPRTTWPATPRCGPRWLEGWDDRHRLSCAAYSGRLVP